MRKIIETQLKIGTIDISDIVFDLKSRDEITKVLLGLQHIYCTPELRDNVFAILLNMIPDSIDKNNGRNGMDLWSIFVLGCIRLSCNCDYDKLKELADYHKNIRRMLLLADFDETLYPLQTLKDNVRMFTPEILDQINTLVVQEGHKQILKKKVDLKGSCDSFVVETNVSFPTDIKLLFNAIRKIILIIACLFGEWGLDGWRQSCHLVSKTKKIFREIQILRKSTSKDEEKKAERETEIIDAHQKYIDNCQALVDKAKSSMDLIPEKLTVSQYARILDVNEYILHAERQIDQIRRRVIENEDIPHEEKIFSIFEPYTEWINKGKAGVSQELGLKVCILKDQYGFILHHHVMQKQTDEKIAVQMVEEAIKKFPNLTQCSFDKGFYSKENKRKLEEILDYVILPKKGKLSNEDKEKEGSERFIDGKRKHSAVESAISALENHSLDICPDKKVKGFKRYVALSVSARNIQILGNIIQQKKIRNKKSNEA